MSGNLIEILAGIVGAGNVLTGNDVQGYAVDHRRRYFGKPLAVVRPGTAQEVAAVVRACAAAKVAVVPQGGNTGLCGGATPDASGAQVVLSLSRLNRVRAVDTLNNTMTVEAGCVLQKLQETAADAGRLFPLSLAAQGTAQIGGNLSTNAGGTGVLRYGNTRELVLGLEVVLPDGQLWDGLRGLRKDNTGYDLKHLFIGAEGTLGVITAAVMKLFPLPRARLTAIAALATQRDALALFDAAREQLGERLTGFEMFSDLCLSLVLRHFPGTASPFRESHPHYALIEVSDMHSEQSAREGLETLLGGALENGLAVDASIAQSLAQVDGMWALREFVSEAQAKEGPNVKHDVSLPISRIVEFIAVTDAEIARAFPGVRMVVFGHLGDGNLHYNVSPPEGVAHEEFVKNGPALNKIVHDSVSRFNGSISAEHGLGQYKNVELRRYKSALELDLMRKVKAALDPLGIMNPGKVL